jgi:hypothetical protein
MIAAIQGICSQPCKQRLEKTDNTSRSAGASDSAAYLSAIWAVGFAVDDNLVVCYRLLDVVCLWCMTATYGQQALSWQQHASRPADEHGFVSSIAVANCIPVRLELTRSSLSLVLHCCIEAVAQA